MVLFASRYRLYNIRYIPLPFPSHLEAGIIAPFSPGLYLVRDEVLDSSHSRMYPFVCMATTII